MSNKWTQETQLDEYQDLLLWKVGLLSSSLYKQMIFFNWFNGLRILERGLKRDVCSSKPFQPNDPFHETLVILVSWLFLKHWQTLFIKPSLPTLPSTNLVSWWLYQQLLLGCPVDSSVAYWTWGQAVLWIKTKKEHKQFVIKYTVHNWLSGFESALKPSPPPLLPILSNPIDQNKRYTFSIVIIKWNQW